MSYEYLTKNDQKTALNLCRAAKSTIKDAHVHASFDPLRLKFMTKSESKSLPGSVPVQVEIDKLTKILEEKDNVE